MHQTRPKEVQDLTRLSGKVTHWKLGKKLKFNHATKCYMYNPESVQENMKHTILWYFEIQTGNLITARRPDLEMIHNEKENLQKTVLSRPGGLQTEN